MSDRTHADQLQAPPVALTAGQSGAERGVALVNGARLAYELTGSGPALVLIHAGVADQRMWEPQLSDLAAQYRVLRFDLRGFGQSDLPPGPFAMRDDIYALLTQLGIRSAHLLGCSIGASIALDVALEHPELVAALVLVSAGSGGTRPPSPVLREYGEAEEAAQRAGDAARYAELNVRTWVVGPRRRPEQVPIAVREYVTQACLHDFDRHWDEVEPRRLSPPAFSRLEEVRAPTLVLAGGEDVPDILEAADILATRVPDVRKVIMPGAAHLPNMEQPDRFNQLVLDFLRAVDVGRAT